MSRFKFILIIFLLSLSLAACKKAETTPQQALQSPNLESQNIETPYQATFLIFTNGTKRIFTDSKYHNKSEVVHIEAASPNTIVVSQPGLTWGDFFETLPMKLSETCLTTGTGQTFCTNSTHTLKFYINGELDNTALSKEIKSSDKLLVSYGVDDTKSEVITSQLNQL